MPTTINDMPSALRAGRELVRRAVGSSRHRGQVQPSLGRAAVGLAAMRVAFGCTALAAPGTAGRAWIGQGASGRDRAVLVRALGGRDIALGLGALLALRSGRDARRWLLMGAASDLVDTVASAAGFVALPKLRRWLVLAASGGAAGAGVLLAVNQPPAA